MSHWSFFFQRQPREGVKQREGGRDRPADDRGQGPDVGRGEGRGGQVHHGRHHRRHLQQAQKLGQILSSPR